MYVISHLIYDHPGYIMEEEETITITKKEWLSVLARLDKLEKENAQLRQEKEQWLQEKKQWLQEREQLRQENAQLRRQVEGLEAEVISGRHFNKYVIYKRCAYYI